HGAGGAAGPAGQGPRAAPRRTPRPPCPTPAAPLGSPSRCPGRHVSVTAGSDGLGTLGPMDPAAPQPTPPRGRTGRNGHPVTRSVPRAVSDAPGTGSARNNGSMSQPNAQAQVQHAQP